MYIHKLDDIANKYNNAYHSTIKIKPSDVKPSTYIDTYIDYSKKCNDEYFKFEIADINRIYD